MYMTVLSMLVSSPDRHALRVKDSLERLLQILGPRLQASNVFSTQKGRSLFKFAMTILFHITFTTCT